MKPTDDLRHEHSAIKLMLKIMEKISSAIRQEKPFDAANVGDIIDFLKVFADKCHHGKEETALFPALIDAGMSREGGPVAVMLHEHAMGRGFISNMTDALTDHNAGDPAAQKALAGNMESYVTLLRNHINKEENVLFPIAEKMLDDQKMQGIEESFARIEEEVVGRGIHER